MIVEYPTKGTILLTPQYHDYSTYTIAGGDDLIIESNKDVDLRDQVVQVKIYQRLWSHSQEWLFYYDLFEAELVAKYKENKEEYFRKRLRRDEIKHNIVYMFKQIKSQFYNVDEDEYRDKLRFCGDL